MRIVKQSLASLALQHLPIIERSHVGHVGTEFYQITTTAMRRQRERHNSHRFIKQNNKFVHVLRFFVHFFAGRYCTTKT